ncbi:heterokaryon incompatibility protein-domain-containing protein [Hypomontagnella submonticulosa]|nr:heterokaryon incompatibility protein-domain-containing protein [Hypomontagnella submonticulosa]
MALYESLPLASGTKEIRVLDLSEVSGTSGTPTIKATMRVVNLEEQPSFAALSYVWGDYSTPRDRIICNGFSVEVTKNCFSALHHLYKVVGATTIWVDAICINQDDMREKFGQIRLMANVYSSAHMVYIWLGEGTKQTDKAMEYLARGGLPFSRCITSYIDEDKMIPTGYSMAIRLALHLYIRLVTNRLRSYQAGLEDIFSRPWIHRLWTLQEAVIPNDMRIVCGEKIIPWVSIVYSLEYMEFFRMKPIAPGFPSAIVDWQQLLAMWKFYHDKSRAPRQEDQGAVENRDPLRNGLDKQEYFIEKGWKYFKILSTTHVILQPLLYCALVLDVLVRLDAETDGKFPDTEYIVEGFVGLFVLLSLIMVLATINHSVLRKYHKIYPQTHSESLMVQIQSRQAAQAADKYFSVYSLVGMKSEEGMSDCSLTGLDIVYQLLIHDLILYTKSLDFLLFTPAQMGNGVPTWVVDWRSARTTWIHARFHLERVEIRWWTSWKRLVWEGNTSRVLGAYIFNMVRYPGATPGSLAKWDIRSGRQLRVQGRIVSRISWFSGTFDEIGDLSTEKSLIRSVQLFLDAAKGYSVLQTVLQLYVMSMAMTMSDLLPSATAVWYDIVSWGKKEGSAWVVQMLRKRGPIWLHNTQRDNERPLSNFHLDLVNYLAREQVALVHCFSDTLSDVGFAPNTVVVGDLVALISGVSLPMVLRERQGGYEVVGPAFFRRAMFGETWMSLNTDNLDEIVLI